MKRNFFGEARPANYDEICDAKNEIGADDFYAQIENVDDDGFGTAGWSANVFESMHGEDTFSTLAYADKEKLIADLKAAGITSIEEL